MNEPCLKKATYYTVETVLARLKIRQKVERARLYAYKCQFCGEFHLTKKKPPADIIVSQVSGTYRSKS